MKQNTLTPFYIIQKLVNLDLTILGIEVFVQG